MRLFRPLADQGDAVAQALLAHMYENGEGVAQDYAVARAGYRKAAEQGDALAQFELWHLYASGRGVSQDQAEAMKWVRKSADQGYPRRSSRAAPPGNRG
jgi:TPR repeat protein